MSNGQTTAAPEARNQQPQASSSGPQPQPAPPHRENGAEGPGNSAITGLLEDGSFQIGLGGGIRINADDIEGERRLAADLTTLNLGIPGLRLTQFNYNVADESGDLRGELDIPQVESAEVRLRLGAGGTASLRGRVRAETSLPALNNPTLTLALGENRELSAAVEVEGAQLTPRRMSKLAITGSGRIELTGGRLSGNLDFDLDYEILASGAINLRFTEAGQLSGNGHAEITQPMLAGTRAELSVAENGDLAGSVTLPASRLQPPVPGLSLQGGSVTLGYENQTLSGGLEEVTLSYRDLGEATLNGTVSGDHLEGSGNFNLSLPGFSEATGRVGYNRSGQFYGDFALGAEDFPEALPVESGRIEGSLDEAGTVSFSGTVTVALASVGTGEFSASYEAGTTTITANVELTDLPGLESTTVLITLVNGQLEGEADIAVDSERLPGIGTRLHVEYRDNLWSAEQEVDFSVDDGKLHGTITLGIAQEEDGGLNVHGGGDVTARIGPNLEGTLVLTINPDGTIDTSGEIRVPEPIELFPERRTERELFQHSQNIPLWAILVAVIRIRAGMRAGIGPGVLRDITVAGEYTIGADELPSFSVTGELYIPAFAEAYLGIGAGLGLDVKLGSLTGGIEGMATAGVYGAISVIPELAYEDGDYLINGTATLAGAAKFKLGLNAWAEVEALWITVWEQEWELAEWVWDLGPTLALQARLSYNFSNPEPPTLEVETGDIPNADQLIQDAIPKDGPPSSGAREALENRAEWSGPTRQPGDHNGVPDELASRAAEPATPDATPRARSGGGAPRENQRPDSRRQQQQEQQDPEHVSSREQAATREEAPPETGPRHPSSPTLGALEEPPVPMPRTREQQEQDLQAARKVLELAFRQASDSEDLKQTYFQRIKRRYQLSYIRFCEDGEKTAVELCINPKIRTIGAVEASGSGLAGRKTRIVYNYDAIGGQTVGVEMNAVLGPDHPQGSTEARGLNRIMNKLTTHTSETGTRRFIRGHLLNAKLGGEGTAVNLFPITLQANSDHKNRIEETVKTWVIDNRYWVYYQVLISTRDIVLDNADKTLNYINASMRCKAAIFTLDNKRVKEFTAPIDSTYTLPGNQSTAKPRYARQDHVDPDDEPIKIREIDNDATIREATSQAQYRLDPRLKQALDEVYGKADVDEDRIESALTEIRGFGPGRVKTLLKLYDDYKKNGDRLIDSLNDGPSKSTVSIINSKTQEVINKLKEL
jgi:hypothetical protein